MTDDPKRYMHISEIGVWPEGEIEIPTRPEHDNLLQYMGTVTRSQPAPRIDLASIKASLDAIDTVYPRKKIAAYMKMNQPTRDELLKRVNPCEIDTAGMSTEQLVAVEFIGVRLLVDNALFDGVVEVYNSDNQVIQTCRL
ncbi:MAG TPA: hypothetical protein VN861_03475 [Candidatus Acidoferrales bacterium]|nr:hypothetical protein [Candidatus Acidoferrales bacterium]